MRKSLLLSASLLFGVTAMATTVNVSLTSASASLKFAPVNGTEEVNLGENLGSATAHKYSFEAAPGDYTISIFNKAEESQGSIIVTVPDSSDPVSFDVLTILAYAMNRDADKKFWKINEDYTIPAELMKNSGNQGVQRKVTTGLVSGTIASQPEKMLAFPALKGDSYTVTFVPDEEKHPDYTRIVKSATLTSNVNANVTIPTAIEYTITVPEEAELFVGQKLVNYIPFAEFKPIKSESADGKTTYTYRLAGGKQTYNYRLTLGDNIVHGGKFGYSAQYPKYSFEITKEEIESHGKPDYVNHNTSDMGGGNVADIWLNINIRNHLLMNQGDSYQLAPQRNWQAIDDQSNNYFIDPDFHYTILDENFAPSNKVVTVDENNVLHANEAGTAIVQVSYDALYCYEYNRVDAFGNFGKDQSFWFGSLWSASWAENTGTFVVTVGENGECSATPNFNLDHQNALREDYTLDSEIDVFYYFETEPGYYYTLRPENAAKVSVANPTVNSEANTVSYAGFSDVEKADDGSYKMLLTFGRNIIRVTDNQGKSVYQVISAKPIGYEISNVTNPDNGSTIYPGEKVNVVFHGLFHPSNKLAGIYNMSAYINYNGNSNGNSLILSPNQYSFAGNVNAQTYQFEVTEDAENEYLLTSGCLNVKGFGSTLGKHRIIDPAVGVSPNFTAPVITAYRGYIPDVKVPITPRLQCNVEFKGLPAHTSISMYYATQKVEPTEGNPMVFDLPSGVYKYSIAAPGYIVYKGDLTIDSETPIEITPQLVSVDPTDTGWDGETLSVPYQIQPNEIGFEGLDGYFKICSGYELAWLASHVNEGNQVNSGVILMNDIELGDHLFTPIDKVNNNFLGNFYGRGHSISGLNVDNTDTGAYSGLFGNLTKSEATICHLTVSGKVKTNQEFAGGIIGSANKRLHLFDLTANVDVEGERCVGGILGYYNVSAKEDDDPTSFLYDVHHYGTIIGKNQVGGVIGMAYYDARKIHTDGITYSRVSHEGDIIMKENSLSSPYIGGLFGELDNINVVDSYSCGNITALEGKEGFTGSIIGQTGPTNWDTPINLTRVYHYGQAPNNVVIANNRHSWMDMSVRVICEDLYLSGEAPAVETPDEEQQDSNETEAEDESVTGQTYLSDEMFADGQVARLLGQGWGQDLSAENSHPVLDGPAVYEVNYTSSIDPDNQQILLTNGTLPTYEPTEQYVRAEWLTSATDGEKVESVSSDSNLYLLFVERVKVETIAISPASIEALEGTQVQLTATVAPENATDATVIWTSTDESVATVSAEGLVTVIKEGQCKIIASAVDGSEVTAECEVSALSGIDSILSDGERTDVYSVSGILLKANASAREIKALPAGIYVAKGLKFSVK